MPCAVISRHLWTRTPAAMDVCLSFSSDQNFRGPTHTHMQMRFGGQRAERPAIALKKNRAERMYAVNGDISSVSTASARICSILLVSVP